MKIISGAQTGADRAALDWAIARGIPHGGWCPKGRKAEDGPIPGQYQVQETPSADYLQRNEWNVRDSDGTAIFTLTAELRRGSGRTAKFAAKMGRPWIHLHADMGVEQCASVLLEWLNCHKVEVLNVAGSRASTEPGVGDFVRLVLGRLFPVQYEQGVEGLIEPGTIPPSEDSPPYGCDRERHFSCCPRARRLRCSTLPMLRVPFPPACVHGGQENQEEFPSS
jgi:hypothetical protein